MSAGPKINLHKEVSAVSLLSKKSMVHQMRQQNLVKFQEFHKEITNTQSGKEILSNRTAMNFRPHQLLEEKSSMMNLETGELPEIEVDPNVIFKSLDNMENAKHSKKPSSHRETKRANTH